MQLTSDSKANSARAATTRTSQGDDRHRLRGARSKAEAKSGRMRAWLMRWVKSVRGGWRTFERFLSDYYRACGVVATATTAAPVRSVYLRTGELLTLEESQGWKTVEVVSGEMWLTQTPATNDLLLGPTSRFEVGGAFPVVIEALGRAEIVLRG